MTKQDFIQRVLSILNEADIAANGAMLVGADTTQIPHYIERLYPAAWRTAVNLFPRNWFKTKSFADNIIEVDAPKGTGYVELPDDFLVLSSFKMKGWDIACFEAQLENEQILRKQSNEFTRGNPKRPVCVISAIGTNGTAGEVLRYYSLPKCADSDGHIIEQALYIPNVRELADSPEIDERLFEPLAYLCASQVMTSFEKHDFSQALAGKAIDMKGQ